MRRHPFACLTCVAGAMLLAVASASGENAEALFKSIYGERMAKVTASPTKADDIALAKELLVAARGTTGDAAVLAVLCNASHTLGMRHADGYATAADALKLLASTVPAQRDACRDKLLDIYAKVIASSASSKEQRAAASDSAMELLSAMTDEAVEARKFTEASALAKRAMAIATSAGNSARAAGIREQANTFAEYEKIQKRVAGLQERVLSNATDVPALEELVRLLIVNLDDAASARQFVARLPQSTLKTAAELSLKPADQLTTTDHLTLGDWYHGIATATKPAPANAWLKAEKHLAAFVEGHTTGDLQRAGATLRLKEVQAAIAKGAAASSLTLERVPELVILGARWGGGNNWHDCTERFKAFTRNNTIVAWADNGWAGGDPTPGWRKQLHVHYRVGDQKRDVWRHEGQQILIHEGRKPPEGDDLVIIDARYGTGTNWVDVTPVVKRSVRANRLSFPVELRAMGVRDPQFGAAKMLFVTYARQGQFHVVHAGDGGTVEIGPK